MGCNIYIERNNCGCCGRSDRLHIAKQSYWRDTTFREYGEYDWDLAWQDVMPIDTIEKLKELTKQCKIMKEYGEYISYDMFWESVEEKKKQYWKQHTSSGHDRYDKQGNYWLHGEFS